MENEKKFPDDYVEELEEIYKCIVKLFETLFSFVHELLFIILSS